MNAEEIQAEMPERVWLTQDMAPFPIVGYAREVKGWEPYVLLSALEACQREREEAVAERDVWRAKSEWAHEKLREMNVRVGTIKRELRRNPVNAVGRRPAGVDPSITNLREWYGYWRHLARSAMGTVRKLEPDWQRAATKGADDAGTGERPAQGAQEPPREEAS